MSRSITFLVICLSIDRQVYFLPTLQNPIAYRSMALLLFSMFYYEVLSSFLNVFLSLTVLSYVIASFYWVMSLNYLIVKRNTISEFIRSVVCEWVPREGTFWNQWMRYLHFIENLFSTIKLAFSFLTWCLVLISNSFSNIILKAYGISAPSEYTTNL